MTEKEAELYEIGYLLKEDLKEEEILSFSEKLRNLLTEKSGLIISEGKAKKQDLAYPIKKESLATFNWIKFLLKPQLIEEIKKYLEEQSFILRFLVIKTQKETAPKPPTFKPKRPRIKKVSPVSGAAEKTVEPKEKPEKEVQIKEEEIDKKIEELLGD